MQNRNQGGKKKTKQLEKQGKDQRLQMQIRNHDMKYLQQETTLELQIQRGIHT